jgi:hypothetical protein
VDINNRVVCFDINKLGDILKKPAMLIVQETVWNRVRRNRDIQKTTRFYIDDYEIPLERYREIFNPIDAEYWYKYQKAHQKAWNGSCFGLAATSGLFFTKDLNPANYGADTVYNIAAPKNPNNALTKMIERFQIAQFLDGVGITPKQKSCNYLLNMV